MLATVLLNLLQPEHLLIILLIVVLFFGGKKIPELMKGIGQGVKEFKDASKGVDEKKEEEEKEKK